MFHYYHHKVSCNWMMELSCWLYFHNNNLIHPYQLMIKYKLFSSFNSFKLQINYCTETQFFVTTVTFTAANKEVWLLHSVKHWKTDWIGSFLYGDPEKFW